MRRLSVAILVAFGCVVSAPWLQAQGQFTSFDAPGAGTGPAQGTLPQQITAAGTIVGNYILIRASSVTAPRGPLMARLQPSTRRVRSKELFPRRSI
jgi:hypothetical protein